MHRKTLIIFTYCLHLNVIIATSNEKEPILNKMFVSNESSANQKIESVVENRPSMTYKNDDVFRFLRGEESGSGPAGSKRRSGFEFILRTARKLLPSLFLNRGLFCGAPKNFPSHIELASKSFKNWGQIIQVDSLQTATPKSSKEIVQLANWAVKNGYTVRPRGFMHNWSPLVVSTDQASCGNTILVDTTKYLTSMHMVSTVPLPAVQVETGASLENLFTFLENLGFGITNHPAPGDITIGGAIAIDGHGSGIPIEGHEGIYGSLSNLVISLDAITWNAVTQSFEIKTFDRSNPETKAFLTNLGRMFITQVTLRVVPAFNMRCVSRTDIPVSELFAHPKTINSSTRTFSKLLEENGSVETILFPFTTVPWTKIWSVTPTKPLSSLAVTRPFNFGFAENVHEVNSDLAERLVAGEWQLTPAFGNLMLTTVIANLQYISDLWGSSKNVQLYVKPTTLRFTANGYAMLTNRGNIQEVISRFYSFYENLIQEYAIHGLFPINGVLEIRVTGLDNPLDVGISNAESPALSALKPLKDRPDLDTAIWIDCLTFPTTPSVSEFMTTMENFMFNSFDPALAIARPEWSKGWAYTNSSTWANQEMIKQTIPKLYKDWDFVISTYNRYDPLRVFSNPFLDNLLQFQT